MPLESTVARGSSNKSVLSLCYGTQGTLSKKTLCLNSDFKTHWPLLEHTSQEGRVTMEATDFTIATIMVAQQSKPSAFCSMAASFSSATTSAAAAETGATSISVSSSIGGSIMLAFCNPKSTTEAAAIRR